MLLFTVKRFLQNVLQESVGLIKQSALKGQQKSSRTHQQSLQMSVHRVADCFTKLNIIERLDLIRRCVNFKQKNFNIKEEGTEVDERTDLYSNQGNSDVTEFLVIDEMTQSTCFKERNTKGEFFACVVRFCPSYKQKRRTFLKETTKQVVFRSSGLQLQKKTRDERSCEISQCRNHRKSNRETLFQKKKKTLKK